MENLNDKEAMHSIDDIEGINEDNYREEMIMVLITLMMMTVPLIISSSVMVIKLYGEQ